MKEIKITFEPIAVVEFTEREVLALERAARTHYDDRCRSLAIPGPDATIVGMKNTLQDGKTEYHLKFRELDTLGKVAESSQYSLSEDAKTLALIYFSVLRLLNKMNKNSQHEVLP